MLPRKRAVGGEVVDHDSHNTEALLKKPRIDSLISSSGAVKVTSATENDNKDIGSSGQNNCSNNNSGSDVVGLANMALGDGNPPDIDEDLHSRQLAVYGRETMRRLFGSNILISGMQGLGCEIAKNLILAGVKSVTLQDEGTVELWDLSSNFIFSGDDVGKNRALASVQKLQELNNAVLISTLTTELTKEKLSDFQVAGDLPDCVELVFS